MTIPNCSCGQPAVAIKPGVNAEYATARDLFGAPDKRLGKIMILAEVRDEFRCLDCLGVRRTSVDNEDGG